MKFSMQITFIQWVFLNYDDKLWNPVRNEATKLDFPTYHQQKRYVSSMISSMTPLDNIAKPNFEM